MIRAKTLVDINHELMLQNRKWGPQHHSNAYWFTILVEEIGEIAKEINESEQSNLILKSNIRSELIQVIAVAVNWLQDIGE